MRRKTWIIVTLILLSLPVLGQVKTTWEDTRFLKGPVTKLAIVSQFRDAQLRDQVAASLVQAFQDKGVPAISIYEVIYYDSMFYYSTIERKLDSAGVDGILIVKLLDAENTDLYIAPGDIIPPFAYNYYEYYSFYYYHDLPIILNPDYYNRPDIDFRIDFYLYQNKGDMVVWGGQTKYLEPANIEKAMKGISKKVAKKLLSGGLAIPQE